MRGWSGWPGVHERLDRTLIPAEAQSSKIPAMKDERAVWENPASRNFSSCSSLRP
jgi:hypothetical protein